MIFLILAWAFSIRPPWESQFSFSLPILRDIITNVLLLITFLLNYYLLIPRYYFKKRYVLYGFFIVMAFLAICLIPITLTGRIPWKPAHPPTAMGYRPPGPPGSRPPDAFSPPPQDDGPLSPGANPASPTRYDTSPDSQFFFVQEVRHSIYLFVTMLLFSIFLRVRARLYVLEKDRINAALTTLKAQINPHFLFNTLNSLYALAVKKDERMSDAVIHLAGLMRYMMKYATGDKISLQKELDYITDYVELQRTRLGNTAAIWYNRQGDADELEIAPMILITFIENAFKYGINPEKDPEIVIVINVEEGHLTLEVSNKKVLNGEPAISMGIGLDNTKQRLDLLYPNRYQLNIRENEQTYSVHLSMLLT